MPSLRNAYLKTRFSTRAIVVTLILIAVAVFSLRNGYNAVWSVGGLLGIVVFVETVTRFPKLIAASFVTLAQIFFIITFSLFMGLSYVTTPAALVNLQLVVSFGLMLATTLVVIQAYLFSKGKLWLTLLAVFTVMNLISFGLVLLLPEAPMIAWVGLGYLSGVIIVLLRSIRLGSKKSNETVKAATETIRSEDAFITAKNYLQEQNADFTVLPNNEGMLVNVGKRMLLVIPVAFKYKPRDNKVEGVPVTNVLSYLSDFGAELSQQYRIPRRRTSVTVLDVSSKFVVPSEGYDTLGLKTKNDPIDGMKTIVVANKKGLISYVGKVRQSDDFKTDDVYLKTVNRKQFS